MTEFMDESMINRSGALIETDPDDVNAFSERSVDAFRGSNPAPESLVGEALCLRLDDRINVRVWNVPIIIVEE